MRKMDTRRLLSYMRRAVDDYGMIQPGDRIAVGISGGKDSLALLAGLAAMRRFYKNPYEVVALTIDMGFENADYSGIEAFCRDLDVPYHVKKTDIGPIIFDIRKEKSPCALCAKMRRGVLHSTAKELGCNKVALGHHRDDAIETFMLNLFHEGRVGCFEPISYLSRRDITVIRPLVYMPEKDVSYFANREKLPVYKAPCPADGHTQREEMKQMLAEWERKYDGVNFRIFGAIQRGEIDGFKQIRGIQKKSASYLGEEEE